MEENLCRICTGTVTDSILLFNTLLPNSETLAVDFLRQLTNLEILDDDDLPQLVCTFCFEKLSDSYNLVQRCISSDAVLRHQVIKQVEATIDYIKIEEAIDNSTETLSVKTSDKYKCDICNSRFNNKIKFRKHKKTHNLVNPFKCEQCSETFSKKLHLNVHLRSHVRNEDKKFTCKTCDKQFIYEYLLKQHEFKHTDEKPYPCTVCSKGCLTAESLRRHMKVHDENYMKKMHSCEICSKEFSYPSFLAEHMKNHTGEKPYLCSFCGKGFRQSGALHYHQRVHTGYKPFTCNICDGKFMSQSVLKVHMRKHTNERPYICHVCGVAFKQSTDLKSHQRTHSGDKPVLCTICGKRMSTTGQLTIHIRTHTGEKPFPCNQCSKAFTTKTMLVKHERIHTGERPYVCDICGRAFNQSSTLKSHRNTHDNNKKKKKVEKQITKYVTCESLVENDDSNNCILYKSDNIESIENEIVAEEFISESVQDVEVKSQYGDVKTQFTVILPAPIPLLHSL